MNEQLIEEVQELLASRVTSVPSIRSGRSSAKKIGNDTARFRRHKRHIVKNSRRANNR